jgi:hypothetical protein
MAPHNGGEAQMTQPRAYQLELFEASMRGNVIVTVRFDSRVWCSIRASLMMIRWILGVARHRCKFHCKLARDSREGH